MELEYVIILSELWSKEDLWITKTIPIIKDQLRKQGRHTSNSYRYEVDFQVFEGKGRPATDVDNYAKKILNAITRTELLWRDDEQIDILSIKRTRKRIFSSTNVKIRIRRIGGQHSGIPTFFRDRCREVSSGRKYTYAYPGYHLAMHLWSQKPNDLKEAEWTDRIESLYGFIDNSDHKGVWKWFWEHFPKCMKLIPKRRMEQFLSGVVQAYKEGKI
jgi:hypothetical protein